MGKWPDFSFPSSGDEEEDARIAASHRKHIANEAEGLCPNGCSPVTVSADGRERTCPVCGYHGITTRIGYNG
jgi:hypothetical protein